MEMRSLVRCLRARPMMIPQQQPSSILLRGHFLNGRQSVRYSSTSDDGSEAPPSNEQNQRPSSTSPFQSPTTTTTTTQENTSASETPSSTAPEFDQILNNINLRNSARPPPFQDTNPNPNPNTNNPDASLSRAVSSSAGTDNYRTPVRRVDLKLGPKLGRQVHVDTERGFDVASSLRVLNMACSENRILQQQRRQKFHIRRGQMRKNLRMERWRKLFKFSFKETVSRIQRMRAQGW